MPLYGTFSSLYMYYATIQIGTPPIPFTVVIDTGSTDLLVPYVDCTTCAGNPKAFYSTEKSKTGIETACDDLPKGVHCASCATANVCNYTVSYVGVSENVTLYSDVASWGPYHAKVSFGGIHSISMRRDASFVYPEGMMGLGYPGASSIHATSFLSSLLEAQGKKFQFSLCLNPVGGQLSLGPPLASWTRSLIGFVPLTSTSTFYEILMKKVEVVHGETHFNVPAMNVQHAIVDSGTPFLTLTKEMKKSWNDLFMSYCGHGLPLLKGMCADVGAKNILQGGCYNFTSADYALYPSISIHLSTMVLTLHPQQYIGPMYQCKAGEVSMAIQEEAGWFILGANVLQSFVTEFDATIGRIGFYEKAEC